MNVIIEIFFITVKSCLEANIQRFLWRDMLLIVLRKSFFLLLCSCFDCERQ